MNPQAIMFVQSQLSLSLSSRHWLLFFSLNLERGPFSLIFFLLETLTVFACFGLTHLCRDMSERVFFFYDFNGLIGEFVHWKPFSCFNVKGLASYYTTVAWSTCSNWIVGLPSNHFSKYTITNSFHCTSRTLCSLKDNRFGVSLQLQALIMWPTGRWKWRGKALCLPSEDRREVFSFHGNAARTVPPLIGQLQWQTGSEYCWHVCACLTTSAWRYCKKVIREVEGWCVQVLSSCVTMVTQLSNDQRVTLLLISCCLFSLIFIPFVSFLFWPLCSFFSCVLILFFYSM